MNLDAQSLITLSVVVANIAAVLFFAYTLQRSNSMRVRPLWKFVALDGVISTASIIIFFLSLGSSLSILNLSAGIFYLLVGSFVFTIEVPGYLDLTAHDERIVSFLEDWRSEVVKLGYDFKNYDTVKSKSSEDKEKLEEVSLYRLVSDFVEHSGRMQNLDKGFWTLVLGEVNRAIDDVQNRSKHPAPKLIEILSLSGLSFLIAQLLRFFG